MTTPNDSTDEAAQADADFQRELSRRVIYSLALPMVRLALVFRVPIKELSTLVDMAYFHETRTQGLKFRQVAGVFGISMRKVAMLSRQLKRNFLQAEQEHALPRRIEFMLWAEPLSEARIKQVLPDEDPDEVEAAIAQLVDEGRIAEADDKPGTYEALRSEHRLVSSDWLARIDGLNNLTAQLANAVWGRFFLSAPSTFARTVSLRIRPQDEDQLRQLYEEVLWPRLVELEELARDDPRARAFDLSLSWAPYQLIKDTAPPLEDEGDPS